MKMEDNYLKYFFSSLINRYSSI